MGMRVGELARRTGVGVSTLRAWERRFQFLDPQRSAAGHRLYAEADVERVDAVVRLVAEGLTLPAAITRVASVGPGALPEGEAEALLYGQILQVAEQGVWVSKDGRTRYANRRMAEIMATSVEVLVATPVLTFFEPDDLPAVRERTAKVRAGHPLHFVTNLRRPDGSTFLAEITTTALFNPAGRYDGAVALVNDITDRHEIEARERLRATLLETLALLGAQALRQRADPQTAATLIVTEAVEAARRLLGADHASLFTLIADTNELELRVASPDTDQRIVVPSGSRSFAGYITLARKGVVAEDTRHDPRFDDCVLPSGEHPGSAVGAPIFGPGGIVGVLIAESATCDTFDQGDAQFIQSMANIIGTALLP